MTDLKAHAVAIPMLTVDEAKARYPTEWILAKEYYPASDEQTIAQIISIATFNNPKINLLEPITVTGVTFMSDEQAPKFIKTLSSPSNKEGRRVTLEDLNAGIPAVVTVKAVYLVFGLKSEKLNELPAGRWQSFTDDEAAKASTVYPDYDYAVVADVAGAKPRLLWTKDGGWQDAG